MPLDTAPTRKTVEQSPSPHTEYDRFMRHIFARDYAGFKEILDRCPEVINCIEIGFLDLHYVDVQSDLGNTALREFDAAVRSRLKILEANLDRRREYCTQQAQKTQPA